MGKSVGFIGNFKGKLGNAVGYKVSLSNSGTNQGVRVYQPNIKNPKSAAQAEQRAKYAPIFATYRALKNIIDRGNESRPYGNKSRLAWLKQAFKANNMPWFEKGAVINHPVGCLLTKGSLPSFVYSIEIENMAIDVLGVTSETAVNTIGAVSTALKAAYSFLKDGDQVTFVQIGNIGGVLQAGVMSIVIDSTSTVATNAFTALDGAIGVDLMLTWSAGAIIISREGDNGQHLRSTECIRIDATTTAAAPYDATSKAAAIESYQNAATTNADWAEESIQ